MPQPLLRVLRIVGVPAAEVRSYWSSEQSAIKRGAVALVIALGATLVAGLVLGAGRETITSHPGLLVLIPAAIGMRGSIFGALAARLGTAILIGQYEPVLTRDSFLGRQISAVALLTATTGAEAGVLAWTIGRLLGLATIPVLELVAVSMLAGLASSVVLVGVTMRLAKEAQRRGWAMDDVGAPTITATGDLVTLPALLAATQVLRSEPLALTLGAIGLVLGIVAVIVGVRSKDELVRRIVVESLGVLTIAVTVDVLAGLVMESRAERLLGIPVLLVLIPPFIANCGSLGGMLASRFASKLHTGQLEPRARPSRLAVLDVSLISLLGMFAFVGVAVVGWLAAVLVGLEPPSVLILIAGTVLAGGMALLLLSVVAYAAATLSFRFGLDPDTHGIPTVTAAMDFLGVLCLVVAMTIVGVG